MKKDKIVFNLILSIILIFFSSCLQDFLELDDDNHPNVDYIYKDPPAAEGVLLNGYLLLPSSYSMDEAATDDAVNNVVANQASLMATGGWTSDFNPLSVWNNAYQSIFYLNTFLDINEKVVWATDNRNSPAAERSEQFRKRFRGEALALRAWANFELLKKHGGIDAEGNPMGAILFDQNILPGMDIYLPRDTYDNSVESILKDLDEAIELLPDEYYDKGTDLVHNAVWGVQNKNRVNGNFSKALKSRVTLFVASQPFYDNPNKWQDAANAAAVLLESIEGVSGLSSTGNVFWKNMNDPEIIFRRNFVTNNTLEQTNFPPSFFGQGQINPTQNLVDAFPMANGFPIDHNESGYNPENPYNGRDPRLSLYVLYDGALGGAIQTNIESPTDGLDRTQTSTKTGYYLFKLLDPNISVNPAGPTTSNHFYTLFRYTEIFLNYAEAANEAWGPNADPNGFGFTPVEIMASIRTRAGIVQPDNYLSSVASSKESLRDLIRNERRIELSFEGFRFWDMRRWDNNLNEPAKGISISDAANTKTIFDVEPRNYEPYMKYGPIPYSETLKNHNLIQNKGWK